ncbi:DNA alkylation repair protein [Bacteroides rodentium]|uniref:DNA alkylation repair protein n=1 Tax=Bacteroides rodentium TaxID=691816 RepID=UPI00100854C6|nr:DNA alkylation repair protein [Bacteroides rodentium]
MGLKVAEIRKVAERYAHICLDEIEQLLLSEVHEHRMCALIILKKRFKRGNEHERAEIFEFYINHTDCINDWDLIDSSSPYIVGEYLHDKPCDVLYRLAQSDSPWDNRIAMMATYTFIHNGNVEDTFHLALSLMKSPHPLVQKAVGWMLHEAGKYDLIRLSLFIDKYRQEMSRVMLRIAAAGFRKEIRRS